MKLHLIQATTLLILFFSVFFTSTKVYAQAIPIELLSSNSSGEGGNDITDPVPPLSAISADNRYVVFESRASNLVSDDTNGVKDIFIKDRQTNITERVSLSTAGDQANGESYYPSISRDGRFVLFTSAATNLVTNAIGGGVYLRDRTNGTTELITRDLNGDPMGGLSWGLSADGRYVAFTSQGALLGGSPFRQDGYVKDMLLNTTTRISVDSSGNEANASSDFLSISADGKYVAFHSEATNLVSNDTNGIFDVFVRDLNNGTTRRVSINSSGEEANARSTNPQISGNGNFVTFISYATNLTSINTFNDSQTYVHDLITGLTEIVSISNQGIANDNSVSYPAISDDGRYVAFNAHGTTLGFTQTTEDDTFRRDRQLNTTEMVSSYNTTCTHGGGIYTSSAMSIDGRFIIYNTENTYLPADTNGTYDIYLRDMNIPAPISCNLTNLFSAKAWVGLANAADSGIKFDLRARVLKNGELLSGDKILSVDGGGTGFANAIQHTIPLPGITPQEMLPGTTLGIRLAVRNACTGSALSAGTARLWYNGEAANSRFKVTLGDMQFFYYLRDNFLLTTQQGAQGEKLFVDVPVGAQCGEWVPFGTWNITF